MHQNVPYVRALNKMLERVRCDNAYPEHAVQLTQNEFNLCPGRLAHHYALNRSHFAKEFHAEANLRSVR